MVTLAQRRRDAIDAWWSRSWPVVILAADPGKRAGAALVDSAPGSIRLMWAREVDTNSLEVEDVVERAFQHAEAVGKQLILAVEDWGAGGDRGLAQWIGLGEQRGAWKRAFSLRYTASGLASTKVLKAVQVPQSRWRSRLCESWGVRDDAGKFRTYSADEWKVEAYETARRLFLDAHVPFGENAAEAVCIGYFAARADSTGALLGKRRLAAHGLSLEMLEGEIHPQSKKTKKKKASVK